MQYLFLSPIRPHNGTIVVCEQTDPIHMKHTVCHPHRTAVAQHSELNINMKPDIPY